MAWGLALRQARPGAGVLRARFFARRALAGEERRDYGAAPLWQGHDYALYPRRLRVWRNW